MHDIFFKRKFFPYFIVPFFQRNLNSKTRISKMLSQLASHFTTLVLHTSIDRPLKALTLHNFYFSLQPVHPLRLGKTFKFFGVQISGNMNLRVKEKESRHFYSCCTLPRQTKENYALPPGRILFKNNHFSRKRRRKLVDVIDLKRRSNLFHQHSFAITRQGSHRF